jgi:Domain of unknown function (DUF4157)
MKETGLPVLGDPPMRQSSVRTADRPLDLARTNSCAFLHARPGAEHGAVSAAHCPGSSEDQALTPSGQSLDEATQTFFESRLGHDFSRIRVHTDAQAAESAGAVHALAYTAGSDIAFAHGQYAPGTSQGRLLLAHELTHVVQQRAGGPSHGSSVQALEAEALESAARLTAGHPVRIAGHARVGMLQMADDKSLDERAQKIIAAAKDTAKPIDQRAVDAVNDILNAYWDPSMVKEIVYSEKEPGLATTPVGKGKDIKGTITVGRYFVEHIDSFARRVIQVGHELQHVRQQREGMGGEVKRHEREFLANAWSATEPEQAGTGRMSHAMRRDYADEALSQYYCLSPDEQKRYADKKTELTTLRDAEDKASGAHKDAPTAKCAR